MAIQFNPYDLFGIYSPQELGLRGPHEEQAGLYKILNDYEDNYLPASGLPGDISGASAIIPKTPDSDLQRIISAKDRALRRSSEAIITAEAALDEAYRGTPEDPKPLDPQEVLDIRIDETWLGWIVHLLSTYDEFCSVIVQFVSDFFYRISEDYHQEADFQGILLDLVDQNVPLHELEHLPARGQLHLAQGVVYDSTYRTCARYLQSIHAYKALVANKKSNLETEQREFNFEYTLVDAILHNHERRAYLLQVLRGELGVRESFFRNVGTARIHPRLNLGLKETLNRTFTEPYGFLPWVQKYRDNSLCVAIKNPAYDDSNENSIQYFLLYEFHEEDSFPDTFSWKLCTIHQNAQTGLNFSSTGFRHYDLVDSDGTYLLNTLDERSPEHDQIHSELEAAIARAAETLQRSLVVI